MTKHFYNTLDCQDGTTTWSTEEAFTAEHDQPKYTFKLETEDFQLYAKTLDWFNYTRDQLEKQRADGVEEL